MKTAKLTIRVGRSHTCKLVMPCPVLP